LPTEVLAHITGTVWKIEVAPGARVSEGDIVVILESMKMEMPVEAPAGGTILEIRVKESQPIAEGAVIAILEEG
jgi:acetyl-CoA carboxylase biotin carboxyl carrier protein